MLVAKPKDFGFYGDGGSQGEGRYTPWRKAESHERFRQDVVRMIKLALRGDDDQLQAQGVQADQAEQLAALPAFSLTDLDGRALSREELDGRVVVVEFWASWCPPCLGTIGWLGELGQRHGDRIGVLAFAVESPEPEVRELVESAGGAVRWALGTPELASAFGDVVAVPTLFVFDREGKTASTFYGNPPDLAKATTPYNKYYIPFNSLSTDFRRMYAEVITKWFNVADHSKILGGTFPLLGIL